MGAIGPPPLVKPFCGLLLRVPEIPAQLREDLERIFGPTEAQTETTPWTFSDYYAREMGQPLWRAFVVFRDLQEADRLSDWKVETNRVESNLANEGRRSVNVDPGYLTPGSVILASTKNAPHRIYLTNGIFAEVTLLFEHGAYQPLPTTYPDYATTSVREFFRVARRSLLTALRARRERP
jgi:hypothetical protein